MRGKSIARIPIPDSVRAIVPEHSLEYRANKLMNEIWDTVDVSAISQVMAMPDPIAANLAAGPAFRGPFSYSVSKVSIKICRHWISRTKNRATYLNQRWFGFRYPAPRVLSGQGKLT